MTSTLQRVLATLLCAVSLTACGSDEPANPVEKMIEDSESWPKCADVWREGETLPEDYEGCINAAGELAVPLEYECSDGTRLIGNDEPPAFARTGGKIRPGGSDEEAFSAEFDSCKPA